MDNKEELNCPECNGDVRHFGGSADWECKRCGALIREVGGLLYTDPEPDKHGSRVRVYERNDVADGMHHE